MKRILTVAIAAVVTAAGARTAAAQENRGMDGIEGESVAVFVDGQLLTRGIILLDSVSGEGELYVSVAELRAVCTGKHLEVAGSRLRTVSQERDELEAEKAAVRSTDGSGVRLHAEREAELSSRVRHVEREPYIPAGDLAHAVGARGIVTNDDLLKQVLGDGTRSWSFGLGALDPLLERAGLDRQLALNIETGARCLLCVVDRF